MPAKRIWTDEDLQREAPRAENMKDLLGALGLRFSGSQYPRIRKDCERLGINLSHFRHGKGTYAIPDTEWVEQRLRKGKPTGPLILRRLVGAGLRTRHCERCGITQWQGTPAPLQVDHINGDPRDNRLDNLAILCANCHALTPTWGKKKRHSAMV